METLDHEIQSRDVYECWQEPCSNVEPFLEVSNDILENWLVSRSSRKFHDKCGIKGWVTYDRTAVIFHILLDHFNRYTLLPRVALGDPRWSVAHERWACFIGPHYIPSGLVRATAGRRGPLPIERTQKLLPSPQNQSFFREQQWVEKHRGEYAGKWVALEGERLLGAGESARDVFQQAVDAGAKSPLVVKIDAADQPPFAGW